YEVAVLSGPEEGQRVTLEGTLFVGSHAECGLRLSDPTVSRYHLELQAGPNGVLVKDLGSTNGTVVSGARIEKALVTEGTTFLAGRTVLRVTAIDRELKVPAYDHPTF